MYMSCVYIYIYISDDCMRIAAIIFWMRPANERRGYIVTSSLIGWPHTENDPGIVFV